MKHEANDDIAVSSTLTYAERALTMMRGLHVLPHPKNYMVFFACVSGQSTDLARDLQQHIANNDPITDHLISDLYTRHLAETQSRVVQETADNTRQILLDMLQNLSNFGGVTDDVRKEMSQQIEALTGPLSEDSIRMIGENVIRTAITMKESTENVSDRMAVAEREIAILRESLARATTESERDFLTGTYNRKAFERRLHDMMEEAKIDRHPLTLLMLDVDHFKKFNDQFGHLIGDEVLKIVAHTMVESVKGMDIVARFGGEEFAIILPYTPIGGGMIVADAIRKSIANKKLRRKSSGEDYGMITVSIGVACFSHEKDTMEGFISRADDALYRAKKAGRNRTMQEHLD